MGKFGYNHGEIGWIQLNVDDPEKAIDFYTKLVGWEKREVPMPDYHVFANGSEMLGGITKSGQEGSPPAWIPYITVSDIEATMARVESLGGAIMVPPQNLPDGGQFIVFRDPCGSYTAAAQYAQGPSEERLGSAINC